MTINNSYSQKKKKEKKEEVKVERKNLIFSKPKNAWQIGVFGGASTLMGDVTPNLFYGNKPLLSGHNFGGFVSKSWSYLISTRLRYSTSVMFTGDAVASTLTQNQINATNRNNDIGFRDFTAGQTIFHNSRTQGHDVNFDLVFTLGNLNWHKRRSPVVFRIFPSVGMFMYQTFYDQLDANGNPYDYSEANNLNDLGVSNRREIIDALSAIKDGKYETRAEEHTVYDENKLFGYNARMTYGLGVGMAIRLTDYLSLDLETRQSFTSDDLIDGMQWQEPGNSSNGFSRGITKGNDSYNQTTLGLTFSIVTNKVGEPLCMQNPLWGDDAFSEKNKQEETDSKIEEMDSTNALLEEKLEKLEKDLENMNLVVKLLAEKTKENTKNDSIRHFDSNETTNYPNKNLNDLDNINNLDDNTFKLRNGEYMQVAELKGDINASYYLISGSFVVKGNAKKDQKNWKEKGFETHLMTDFESSLYRVVIDYTNNHEEALDMLEDYKKRVLKSIWVIKAR